MMRTLASAATPIPPVKLAHVVLRTTQLEEMRDWYVNVLGATVHFENAMAAGISFDEEHHRIALLRVPPVEAQPTNEAALIQGSAVVADDVTADIGNATFSPGPGLEHIAFTFESMRDLLSTYRRLKEQGVEPQLAFNHGVNTSFYYSDPDGNRIELQIDNWTMEEAREYLTSDVAERNPLGVAVDPEDLIARFEGGEPIRKMVECTWA